MPSPAMIGPLLAVGLLWSGSAPPTDVAPVEVQRPGQEPTQAPTEGSQTTETTETSEAGNNIDPAGPSGPGTEPDQSRESADDLSTTQDDSAPQSKDGPEEAAPPLLAPSSDAANYEVSDAPARPRDTPSTSTDRDEQLRRHYRQLYRPADNPMRPYFATRAWFSIGGSSQIEGGGGRLGAVNVEAGQTWNHIGYALGGTMLFGQIVYGEDPRPQANVLVGGGPSLNLGRLGLVRRSVLDLRAGYNFFYGVTNATVLGAADPPDVAPHGPKVQLDAALMLNTNRTRRLRHALGATLGWQLLVHDLSGHFPLTNMINVGVLYTFG